MARAAAALGGTALAAGLLGWAAAVLFAPAPTLPETEFALATVAQGEVSSEIDLSVSVEWPSAGHATNQATGIVTSIAARSGEMVDSGAVLFEVDLRPVVVVRGSVPAFRALGPGTIGEDVAQLQEFLVQAGFLSGVADGDFGPATTRAVEEWQETLGIESDGVVRLGDIVFSSELPAHVDLNPEAIAVGQQVAGGERVIRMLASEPSFSVAVSPEQSAQLATGASVEITGPAGEQWSAALGERAVGDEGTVNIALDGGVTGICGDACASIPLGPAIALDARIVLVEPARGLVVPTGALVTRPAGEVVVVDESGAEHTVRVIASARGISVVDGIREGLAVRVPGEADGNLR